MTTGTIHVLSCTFENTSEDHWVNVHVREATVRGNKVKATVLSAADVNAFTSALIYKKKKDQHNTAMALNLVAVGGLVVAGSKNTSSVAKTVGLLASTTALTAAEIAALTSQRNHGQFAQEHMYGGMTRIPPGLFVRKGIVVEAPKAEWQPNSIEVCFKSPAVECVSLSLNSESTMPRRRIVQILNDPV
jgi:hypothetical protein